MLGFGGSLIIPKLLFLTSGHIAIRFGSFLERRKKRPIIDPRTKYLSPTTFQNIQETVSTHRLDIIFAYRSMLGIQQIQLLDTTAHPQIENGICLFSLCLNYGGPKNWLLTGFS